MNLALSDEQELLREAARNALSRVKTIEAAREALEHGDAHQALPDLWPTAVEAGWTGLVVGEERGGAGLGAFEAMLVLQECGRVLAGVPILGHVLATYVLDGAGYDGIEALAGGEKRAALVVARPPDDLEDAWTVEPLRGKQRAAAPAVDGGGALSGSASWVPDAPGADVLVVVAMGESGPVAVVVEGAAVEEVSRYDATRSLGHVALDGSSGTVLDPGEEKLANAWYLAQALLAAESLGAVEACLEMAVDYAKERFTFGRAIGSYQAVKHSLTEILRRQENTRSLLLYAGWAAQDKPDEFPLAASAARAAAGSALDHAARTNIAVHGGIGATWEHDAPLFFRRAELSERLLGGTHDAVDRVAG
ncbi:MAG: acyl-CoA dehydrogenase domain protein, partial [Solirubrobacteraceae bacterium]|nr:acyl-CoA dehydrogenase domain protein [Solirubrobacteraceae bacterium]